MQWLRSKPKKARRRRKNARKRRPKRRVARHLTTNRRQWRPSRSQIGRPISTASWRRRANGRVMSMKKAASSTTNITTRMKNTHPSFPKLSKSQGRINRSYLNHRLRKWRKKNLKLTLISARRLSLTTVFLHRPSLKARLSPSRLLILKMSKVKSLLRPPKFSRKWSLRRRHKWLTEMVSSTIKYKN